MSRGFRLGQLGSGGLLALSHGTNDAQKTMGVITLALIANRDIPANHFYVPDWVVITAASAIALGTFTGGWRIIKTLGTRITNMDPAQGFAAQGPGAAVILAASSVGYPLSTTHVISGGIMGAGAAKRFFSVVVLGAIRSSDMRRANRSGAAAGYVVLATIGLILTTAIVIYGLALVAHKT